LFSACGDANLLSGLAAEDSDQAKLEKAQAALDEGDCPTALTLFAELQASDSTRVDRRIDLTAAYLCRAGFDVQAFVEVAAEFGVNDVADTELFRSVATRTVATIASTWPEDLSAAEALLANDPTATPLTAFQGNDDAAFSLAIVQAVKAVLTVSDILNLVNGLVDCAASQGAAAFANCQITAQNMAEIMDALETSSDLLDAVGVSSEVRDTIATMVADINAVDGDSTNAVTCADMTSYLANQGFDMSGVSCV